MRQRERLIEKLGGCIDGQHRAADAESITPEEIKTDWTSDLPS